MQNLTIIENELVPVYETNKGEKVVYGTELHGVLAVKSPYREWSARRLKDCDAVENEDYEAVENSTPSGQTKKDHIIKLDTAKEMAMLERNEKGKQVRRYFIQVEKKYKANFLEDMSPELRAVITVDRRVTQVERKADGLRQEFEEFKEDMPILGIEEDRIKIAVKRKGVQCLGGKNSNAYNDCSLRGKLYSDMYRQLYRQFGISTYKAIKRNQCDRAVDVIEGYEPPFILGEQIANCNAQMNMEV